MTRGNVHIEVLVEDLSGSKLLEALLPKLIGERGQPHSWRIHNYRGAGHIPKNLRFCSDPSKRILLDQLPRILIGYGRPKGIDAVLVVLDNDKRNCVSFLAELKALVARCHPAPPKTLIRLAIEEIEAWYFGDRLALQRAFPQARQDILNRYVQDSPCNTWELLADAVHFGGSASIKKGGWPLPGQIKSEWADRIAPWMETNRNLSPSFGKLRDGLRRLVSS